MIKPRPRVLLVIGRAKPWEHEKIARLSQSFGVMGWGRPVRLSSGLAAGGITCTRRLHAR